MDIDRRNLLKGAAVIGGVAALSGLAACTQQKPSTPTEDKKKEWDEEFDIVIVGGGGAGLIAGIECGNNDPAAKIIILEKMSAAGGSTSLSGGNIGAMGTANLLAFAESSKNPIYKDDTHQMYLEDKLKAGCYYGHEPITKLFCYNSTDNFNWNESMGIKWNGSRYYENPVEEPSNWRVSKLFQASQYMSVYDNTGMSDMVNRRFRYNIGSTYTNTKGEQLSGGRADFGCWMDNFAKNPNGELRTDAPVKSIVRAGNMTGDVTGVVLENGKKIRAKRAVILASGGYAGNANMINFYDPRVPKDVKTSGGPGNTGDMLTAAQLIGGQLVNMHCIQIDFGGSVKEPSMSGNNSSNILNGARAFVEVNKSGKRFWPEKGGDEQYMDAENCILHAGGIRSWFRVGDKNGLANRTPENMAEFEKTYGKVCQTLDEVATFIGCPAATLKETIANYNKYVDAKKDDEWGKQKSLLTNRIETPPFYVSEHTFYCRTTPGGLQIDTNAQVVDVLGQPIPRLFAGGEVTGNVHGRFRNNGGDSMCDVTCFGRLSAQSAIKLKSVE